jgi:hypothetical protein
MAESVTGETGVVLYLRAIVIGEKISRWETYLAGPCDLDDIYLNVFEVFVAIQTPGWLSEMSVKGETFAFGLLHNVFLSPVLMAPISVSYPRLPFFPQTFQLKPFNFNLWTMW